MKVVEVQQDRLLLSFATERPLAGVTCHLELSLAPDFGSQMLARSPASLHLHSYVPLGVFKPRVALISHPVELNVTLELTRGVEG